MSSSNIETSIPDAESGSGTSHEAPAGSRESERVSSEGNPHTQTSGRTTSALPRVSEGVSQGSRSRQSGGEAQANQAEAVSKQEPESLEDTPVVKESLTAMSGPAKRRLPMLCQASSSQSESAQQTVCICALAYCITSCMYPESLQIL